MSAVAQTPQSQTLEGLMQQFVAGDEAAFTKLYEKLSPVLLAKLRATCRDVEQARDVVQVTLLKLYRAKDKYEAGAPVLPWALVIAKRTLIDEQRPLSARCEVLSSDGVLPEGTRPAQLDTLELIRVKQALAQLPTQYRDAIALTKLSGMSGNEAATQLKTTSAAIKQRVHRGYELLRTLLDPVSGSTAAA